LKLPPLVSIVVPVYNSEETIEDCLNSLINQRYPRKEIIVLNDGSTDGTGEKLSKIAARHPKMKVINKEHEGITATRNLGIKMARGELLLFGEADAIYNSDYLEKAVDCMASDPNMAGVCVTGAPWKLRSTFVTECIDAENQIRHKLLKEGKLKPFYAWLFRKEALVAAGGFDEKLKQAEDRDLFLRVKEMGFSIGLVPGINWRHRRQEDSWTYVKKSYRRGKTRVLYLLKHRRIIELLRNVGMLWLIVFLLAASTLWTPFLLLLILVAALALMYELWSVLRVGWDVVSKRRYLVLLPLFRAMRYSAFAAGYTYGLVRILILKAKGRPVYWSTMNGDR